MNLPKHVETIILVDERGKEYRTKYLADKTGLSAGWRGFSIAHELAEGDVIVFQLVQACKFKVTLLFMWPLDLNTNCIPAAGHSGITKNA